MKNKMLLLVLIFLLSACKKSYPQSVSESYLLQENVLCEQYVTPNETLDASKWACYNASREYDDETFVYCEIRKDGETTDSRRFPSSEIDYRDICE